MIETMVVLSILGILAAIAVPSLLPLLAKTRLHAEAEAVASFVDRARRQAVSEGRCFRIVSILGGLRLERRTVGDCVNLGTELTSWTQVASYFPPAGVALVGAPESLTLPPAPANNDDHRLIFRPNGRLWGDGDVDVTDDGARVRLVTIAAPVERRTVVATALGRVCVYSHGNAAFPTATVASMRCP